MNQKLHENGQGKSNSYAQQKAPQLDVYQLFTKINKTIDDLDFHIQQVINKHEAEFLFAYRNHMKKIKKQLSQLKQRSDEQEKQFTSNDRIQFLQKQISIFRQQALKLYDKLEQKTHECDQLKIKLKEYEKQNAVYQKQTKEFVKKIKLYELQQQIFNSQLDKQEKQSKEIKFSRQLPSLSKSIKQNIHNKSLAEILQQHLKGAEFDNIYKQLNQYIRLKDEQWKQRLEKYRKKIPINLVNNSEIKQWFLDCVKTIKRQIHKRKQLQSNSFSHILNFQQFLSIDKLRLLQIFLSNEKLLSHMYLKMFPDRLTELADYLSVKQTKLKEIQNGQQKSNTERQVTPKNNEEYELDDLQKPTIVSKKIKNPKNLLRNKVIIKNGKLNMTSS